MNLFAFLPSETRTRSCKGRTSEKSGRKNVEFPSAQKEDNEENKVDFTDETSEMQSIQRQATKKVFLRFDARLLFTLYAMDDREPFNLLPFCLIRQRNGQSKMQNK